MVVHQGKLQNKQAFLFRLVDVANELFAMAASVCRAKALADAGHRDAANATELTDLFCRMSRRLIRRLFRDLWSNDDVRKYRVALRVLDGRHAWLEQGILALEDQLREPAAGPKAVPASVGGVGGRRGGKPERVPSVRSAAAN